MPFIGGKFVPPASPASPAAPQQTPSPHLRDADDVFATLAHSPSPRQPSAAQSKYAQAKEIVQGGLRRLHFEERLFAKRLNRNPTREEMQLAEEKYKDVRRQDRLKLREDRVKKLEEWDNKWGAGARGDRETTEVAGRIRLEHYKEEAPNLCKEAHAELTRQFTYRCELLMEKAMLTDALDAIRLERDWLKEKLIENIAK